MSITTAARLRNATAAVEAITGRKFCRKCNSHKPFSGGVSALDSRHRTVWYCADCTRIASGQANSATTPAVLTSAKTRPMTEKRSASVCLTDFWKLAHKPLEKS